MATMADLGDVVVNIIGNDKPLKSMLKKVGAAAAAYLSFQAAKVAVTEYAGAEEGDLKLAAAIKTRGGAIKELLPVMDQYAKARMISVGMDDDAIKGAMSYGMQLGVSKDKIQEATDAAIGLSAKLGIDLHSAMNIIGRASTGNTQMLGRYGVAIDQTKSAAEQFQQVLDFGMNGMGLAEAKAGMLAGAMNGVKVGFGEVTESIGMMIAESLALPEFLKAISSGLHKIASWLDGLKSKFITAGGSFKKFAVDTAEFFKLISKEEADRTKAAIDRQVSDKIAGLDKEKALASVSEQEVVIHEKNKQEAIKETQAIRETQAIKETQAIQEPQAIQETQTIQHVGFKDLGNAFEALANENTKAETGLEKAMTGGVGPAGSEQFRKEMAACREWDKKSRSEDWEKKVLEAGAKLLEATKENKPLPVMG